MLVTVICAASALADQSGDEGGSLPTPADIAAAVESSPPGAVDQELTDPSAAQGVPLTDLGRAEALDLLTGVFGQQVEAPAGVYDNLQGAELLSSNVAVVPEGATEAGEEKEELEGSLEGAGGPAEGEGSESAEAEAAPEAEAKEVGEEPPSAPAEVANADLVDSTVPLEAAGQSASDPVDLSLTSSGGHLEPVAPLVEVKIPSELGDGIELPGAGIGISLAGAPAERAPTVIDNSVAVYPNVDAGTGASVDSDLAVSPTPSGVETLTQLRGPNSPTTQTYELSLPPGAELASTAAGGAKVVSSGGEVLMTVEPPSALDATGKPVPTELEVAGSAVKIHVEPPADATAPILLDPLFQTYEWAAKGTSKGICSNSFKEENPSSCNNREEWGYEVVEYPWGGLPHLKTANNWGPSQPGIYVHAEGQQRSGDHATVLYTVPRYFKESPAPTSYIKDLKLSDVTWQALGQYASPYLFMGIWDASKPGWVSYFSHTGQVEHGLNEPAFVYNFPNEIEGTHGEIDTHAKAAEVGIYDTEASAGSNATAYVGAATVELGDTDAPSAPVPTIQTKWVNQSAPPLAFTASDTGLGVYAITAATEEVDSQGHPLHSWKDLNGCVGVGDSACPRTWSSTESGHPSLTYEPGMLPTGIDYLSLVAEDPVGNKSAQAWEQVHVDHIAPVVSLSGSMTEQATLGTRRSSYTLKVTGSDGTAEHPQSGIARAELKLDGKAVAMEGKQKEEWTPNCTTENCPLAAEWTLNTAGLSEGQHTVEVIATDAAGVSSAPQTLTIETHAAPAPTVALSGSITEEATLGSSRPRYLLNVKSTAAAAGFESPNLGATPLYVSSIGGLGTENGKFIAPADVATDSKGDLWVLDRSQARLQELNEKGEWLRNAGSEGSGAGMLSSPSGVAVDTSGNVWVADTANNRVVEFNEKGEFVLTFGTTVNKTKVEAAGTEAEKNLCTAASGNVCQAATAGSGSGQMKAPQGIATTSSGNLWVADTGNNRLEKFSPAGSLINNISGEGTEAGKLKEPSAITVAPDGSIWVADTANNRIEQWNSSLAFVRAIGKEGTGGGEFKGPAAIEADSSGDIWVGDRGNSRVEEFDEYGTYLKQFGSKGTGGGQFSFSGQMGLTVDGSGNIWITDGHFHVQRWTIPGFPVYLTTIGGLGSGNGKFFHPADVATDAKGNVWALDSEQARIQEFNEKGEWLRTTGSSGSGAGMLSSPSALAVDSSGNVWVADTANNRVVEFSEKGEFVQTFGTGVNKTKSETTGTTEAEKNLCTAASGNVCRAGTAGSAQGQLSSPRGIAATAGGNLWVADTANNRIEKFTPSGGFLNKVASEGTEAGKLKEPSAITLAPDGSVWVADTGNNRIEAWNSSLTFLRAVGKEGTGGGEFKGPAAIEADSSGNLWVGDRTNNRVEEFTEGGKYLGEFGATGSGKIGFGSSSIGIAVDAGGAIWVTDPNHWKIQKWHQETPRSEVTTTVWFNGTQETSVHGGCLTTSCTVEPQWTLESPSYSAGTYPVRVKTSDGLGRSTESTLNVQVERDTTKPSIELGGELANAPEGWVEQESYGLNASASDGGFGLNSVALKIDGQQVASTSQSCADGGCNETLSKQVSMATYSGGSHTAEVVATDGAGNSAVKKWTINVDPEGHISTQEASATLDAMEETTSVNPIGDSAQEAFVEGTVSGLGLEATGSSYASSGGEVPLTVGSQPSHPMTMQILPADAFSVCEPEYFSAEEMAELSVTTLEPEEAEPGPSPECETPETSPTAGSGTQAISVIPISTAAGAEANTLVEDNASLAANTATAVDTITRPLYEGALTFEAIRDEAGPTAFTWEVHLEGGQELKLIDPQHAMVYYAGGHPAFGIAAEPASDAIGTNVPTELEVSAGDLVTLVVKHRGGSSVYPVLAGAGWQGGFTSVEIQGPKDEKELREERERIEQEDEELQEAEEAGEVSEGSVSTVGLEDLVSISVTGPPEPAPYSTDGPPLTGGVQQYTFKHHFRFFTCDYAAGGPAVPEAPRIYEWAASRPNHCVKWITKETPLNAAMNVKGWWKSNQVSQYTWIPKGDLECNKWGRAQPALVHCLKRPDEPAEEGHSVHVLGDFRFPPGNNYFIGSPVSASPPACVTVQGRLMNGPESKKEEPVISPAKVGEKCDWP
jgi:streptogramin lyase